MTIQQEQKILHRIAQWLVVVLIIVLPWQTRWIGIEGVLNGDPWAFGTVALYGVDIIIGLLLATVGLYVALGGTRPRLTIRHGIAAVVVVIALLSMGVAGNRVNTLYWGVKLVEGVALLFVLPIVRPSFQRVAHAVLATGLMQAVVAMWQFTYQRVVGWKWLGISEQLPEHLGVQVIEVMGDRVLRAYGSLPHPNMLGGLLVLSIIFGIALFVRSKKELLPAYGLALVVLSGALWMTFSRQAWLALLVVLTVMVTVVFVREKSFPARRALAVLLTLIPLVALTIASPELIQTRISGADRLEERSINERVEYVDQSLDVITQRWVTGTGIGNYTAFIHTADNNAGRTEVDGYAYQPVHNIYLLVFAELGLFGFLAFLLFLASQVYGLSFKKLTTPEMLPMRMAMTALIIIGLFDHYLWSLHVGIVLFWLMAGLYESTRSQDNE